MEKQIVIIIWTKFQKEVVNEITKFIENEGCIVLESHKGETPIKKGSKVLKKTSGECIVFVVQPEEDCSCQNTKNLGGELFNRYGDNYLSENKDEQNVILAHILKKN